MYLQLFTIHKYLSDIAPTVALINCIYYLARGLLACVGFIGSLAKPQVFGMVL